MVLVEGADKMKNKILMIILLIIGYIIASKFFIDFFPVKEQELVGKYESSYEGKKYSLVIAPDKTVEFKVTENNNIIYQDTCKDYNIETEKYRVFPIHILSFNKCKNMDSNTDIKRDLWFNILIGNNGSELKRIDPDSNVYFKKE